VRKAINITINGETHTLKEWAEISGLSLTTISIRIKNGVTGADIIKPSKKPKKPLSTTINGETHTLSEWAEIANLSYGTIWIRYRKGIRGEELIKPSRIKSKRIKHTHIKRFVWIGDKK
jgi:hypothetical protein